MKLIRDLFRPRSADHSASGQRNDARPTWTITVPRSLASAGRPADPHPHRRGASWNDTLLPRTRR
jgi:hypothetical protein